MFSTCDFKNHSAEVLFLILIIFKCLYKFFSCFLIIACFLLIFKHKQRKNNMSILFFNQIHLTHIQVIGYFSHFQYKKEEELSIALVPLYSHTHISYSLVDHFLDSPCNIDNPHNCINSSYFLFIHTSAS